jgi:hypothetical protein
VAPAGIASIVARLQLPAASAQRLAGQSVPVVFDVTARADGAQRSAVQREKSTLYVPR